MNSELPFIRLWTKFGAIKSLYTAKDHGTREHAIVTEEDIKDCDDNRLVEIPWCNQLTFSHGCPNENQIIFIERCEKVEIGGGQTENKWSRSDKNAWKGRVSGSNLSVGDIVDCQVSSKSLFFCHCGGGGSISHFRRTCIGS